MRVRKWIIPAAACMLSASAIAADAPSMILVNGSVLTMDASDRVTQAIAVRDGTIAGARFGYAGRGDRRFKSEPWLRATKARAVADFAPAARDP
jgi:hypothetical protein